MTGCLSSYSFGVGSSGNKIVDSDHLDLTRAVLFNGNLASSPLQARIHVLSCFLEFFGEAFGFYLFNFE
jgi:hypothetical protein